MIEVVDVWYRYPEGSVALRGVSLQIERGEFIAIMGENGAGKTTLIKHFNGLLKPQRGEVFVDGINTKESSIAELSKKVGVVFQNPDHQLFSSTVEEEIMFSLNNLNIDADEARRRMEWVLKLLDLERYRKRSPFSLSGGEKKRLALATILCMKPKVLVLDEPTMGQDFEQKMKLAELLQNLVRKGTTVVVVTHDVEFAAMYFPRVVLMARGRIIADGVPEDVLTNDEILRRASLIPPQATKIAWEVSRELEDFPRKIIRVKELYEAVISLVR
ncbi:MAG: energy-coupling factor ABC transporter ATP-binding protein [Candidatus Baldrarchaeia archaeon]